VDKVVLVAKESVNALLLTRGGMGEIAFGDGAVLLNQRLVDIELLYAIQARVLELLFARHAVFLHGVGNLEGGVDEDAVEAVELFGIHAAHGGADDEVRLFAIGQLSQHGNSLLRMDGNVGGNDRSVGKDFADAGHRSRLSTGAEAVDVHDFLSLEKLGKLLDILVCLFHTDAKVRKYFLSAATFRCFPASKG